MSQREVERTLGRLLTDEKFREEFFQEPAGACFYAGLGLSEEEIEAVSRVSRLYVEELSADLDGRICRFRIPEEPQGRP